MENENIKEYTKDVVVAVIARKQDSQEPNVEIFKNKEGVEKGVSFSCFLKDKENGNLPVFIDVTDFSPNTIDYVKKGKFRAGDVIHCIGRFVESEYNGVKRNEFVIDGNYGLSKVDNIYTLTHKQVGKKTKDGKPLKTFATVLGLFNQEHSKVVKNAEGKEFGVMSLILLERGKDAEGKACVIKKPIKVCFTDKENLSWFKKVLVQKEEDLKKRLYAVKGNLSKDKDGNLTVWAEDRVKYVKGKDGENIKVGTYSIAFPIPVKVLKEKYPQISVMEEKIEKDKTENKSKAVDDFAL